MSFFRVAVQYDIKGDSKSSEFLYSIGHKLYKFLLVVSSNNDYLAAFPKHYRIHSVCDWLWPWKVRFRKDNLNYKPRALSDLCVNIS